MLLTIKTKELPMNILPLINETLDGFLLKSHQIHKEAVQKALERYDKDIYCSIDRKRFELIRIDERTILSSYGVLRFKRRYYYDSYMRCYCYPLDSRLGIPRSKRMTNELIIRMMELASIMSYKEVGEHLSGEFSISKFTVWKTIRDTMLETRFDSDVRRLGMKVHVQLDEKYIGMANSRSKRRYYTLTIFAGKEAKGKSCRLLNKTVISSSRLPELKRRLNELLIDRYGVSPDEEIFVSGDMASYIQNFRDAVTCCKARYVPDKFHVCKALMDALPDVHVDDCSLADEAKKLRGLIKRNGGSLETYLDPEYLGCSQECQNSHIYAPRFGKYANRFSPSTIEKLALIREAKAMGAKIILIHKRREIPEPICLSAPKPYEDIAKYVLDTRLMKSETAKIFNQIKYGGL